MNTQKLIIKCNTEDFQTTVMTKAATQSKLDEIESQLIEKIDELNKKLEIIKNKQWKFKVNDLVIHDKFVFRIIELLDDNKYLYKAERLDYAGIIDKAGYTLHKGTNENWYFDTNDNLIKMESLTDYAAQLFKLTVAKEKEVLN